MAFGTEDHLKFCRCALVMPECDADYRTRLFQVVTDTNDLGTLAIAGSHMLDTLGAKYKLRRGGVVLQ